MLPMLKQRIEKLCGARAERVLENPDGAETLVVFSDGTKVTASYWRLLDGPNSVSSFDHKQKYGLPAPIDALAKLKNSIEGHVTKSVFFDQSSGDIEFVFEDGKRYQIFRFSGYEVWEIEFLDKTGEYSNSVVLT